jgi:hypothetical protein
MFTIDYCEKNIIIGAFVIGPGGMEYKVTNTRLNGLVREYELSTLSGQWSNWFPFTDVKKIVRKAVK